MKLLKNTQSGRSMVEMLGVLAIIGVLSVGGIAGYSKAMFKYKMSKTMDILSHDIAKTMELAISGNAYIRLDDPQFLKAINFECDWDPDVGVCKLPIGSFYLHAADGDMQIFFEGRSSADACTYFFTSELYNYVPEEWWYNEQPHAIIGVDGNAVFGKSQKALEYGAKATLNAGDISSACSPCQENNGCMIHWALGYGGLYK